jgi:hypothetical protein
MNSRPTFVALFATVLLVSGGCGGNSGPSSDKRATSASPSTAASAGALISYGKHGVSLENVGDVAKLKGAPEDFKTFITGLLEDMKPDEDCQYKPAYAVDAIDPAGYASGGFGDCGGVYLIWARVAGQWKQVLDGQDHPRCEDLTRLAIPKAIVANDRVGGDTCYDAKVHEVPYQP